MYRRVLTTLLITLALATASIAHIRGQEPETGAYEERLTIEEEREAAQVAERFVKGFEERNDPSSLIGELYVKDFDSRLRHDPNPYIYLVRLEPEVLASASDAELRRLYAASLNFIYSNGLLYGISLYNRKLNGIAQDDDDDMPLNELLPPGVSAVLKSDPLMAAMMAEDEENEREREGEPKGAPGESMNESPEGEERADGPEIRSLERLRGFLSTLEKAGNLLREHLKTVRGPRGWKELSDALRTLGVKEEDDSCQGMCPRVRILNDEFFGLAKGTRLVCVNVMVFHMDLVRVDGRLRILNVYLADD